MAGFVTIERCVAISSLSLSVRLLGRDLDATPCPGHRGKGVLGINPAGRGALDEPLQLGARRATPSSAQAGVDSLGIVLIDSELGVMLSDGTAPSHKRSHGSDAAAAIFACSRAAPLASLKRAASLGGIGMCTSGHGAEFTSVNSRVKLKWWRWVLAGMASRAAAWALRPAQNFGEQRGKTSRRDC